MERMSASSPFRQGFTLLQLVIALAILAILTSIAVPGMELLVQASRVQTEAHRLMTSIVLTRNEAVKRNSPVSMCPSSMALTGKPVCDGIFADGWIVFSNRDRDRVVDAGEDEVIRIFPALPAGLTITNRKGTIPASETITYRADGSSGRNRTFLLCPPSGSKAKSRSIVMNIVGRPRMASDWGECPAG